PGVAARFVIMFAKDTLEDPANRVERDGFLDEIERISDSTGVFDGKQLEALEAFLAAPGPKVVPEPARLEHYARAAATVATDLEIGRVGSGWRISCTGCGEASPLVQFRWELFDQTVACLCN